MGVKYLFNTDIPRFPGRSLRALLLFAFLIGGSAAMVVRGQGNPDRSPTIEKIGGEKFIIHTVRKGQTLYGVAERYAIEIPHIRAANPDVDVTDLQVGQTVRIPMRAVGVRVHEVQRSETLYSIGKEYGVSVDRILERNPKANSGIEPGDRLWIPLNKKASQDTMVSESATKDTGKVHVVSEGETLFSIAERYGTDVDTLLSLNSVSAETLELGDSLILPQGQQRRSENSRKPKRGSDTARSRSGLRQHVVKKGETLFSIAQQYDVPIDVITGNNPVVERALAIDDTLLIPMEWGDEESSKSVDTGRASTDDGPLRVELGVGKSGDTLGFYEVRAGESIDSIAERFGLDPRFLLLFNNKFPEGVQEGDILLIPRLSKSGIRKMTKDSIVKKDRYEVVVLLPLFLEKNDSIMKERPLDAEDPFYDLTQQSLEFLNGVIVAADSLRQQGLSLRLRVYDTARDTAKLKRLFKEKRLWKSDLFIGPLYPGPLKMAAAYAKEHAIHLVSPLKGNERLLLGNPYVSKPVPSTVTQIQHMARYLAEKHQHHNVIMMKSGKEKDAHLQRIFRDNFNRRIGEMDSSFRDSLFVSELKDHKVEGLKKKLEPDTPNILAIPSDDDVLLSNLLNRLSAMETEYPVRIFGPEAWLDFNNIGFDYRHRFNMHVVSSTHLNYEKPRTIRFIKSYRRRFYVDPTQKSTLGYDIGWYYFRALHQYGRNFPEHFPKHDPELVHLDIEPYRTGVNSGYENRHVFLLKYEDHRLIDVFHDLEESR